MITTAAEYYQHVQPYDRDRIQAQINRIPHNINRAGKHYKKLLQIIRQNHADNIIQNHI